jgi:mono/diheme cytochrome c family protein
MRRSEAASDEDRHRGAGATSLSRAARMTGCAAMIAVLSPTVGAAEEVTVETLSLGQALYAETCASCHGAKLEGQPDWKRRLPSGRMPAPPHDVSGHTWHHADDVLFQITKDGVEAVVGGGYQSDMPAFRDKLSDDEIRAILAFIKSSWAERERGFQAEVTRASQEVSR